MTPTSEARLLVVDDEPNIRELLSTSLRFAGFEVHTAADGQEALAQAERTRPDLVVLDVMLPDLDGFSVTRRLRERGRDVPVLFLTAKDDVADRVTGLTVGGDDYVTKPFSLEEVVARIRAVLRRSGAGSDPTAGRMVFADLELDEDKVSGLTLGGDDYVTKPFSLEEVVARIRAVLRRSGAGSDPTAGRMVFADLELDEDAHEVRRAGKVVELSPTEFKLLRYLMLNPNRVLSKAQILDHVWNYDFGGEAGIVESYISYLRRKIDTVVGEDGVAVTPLIHTRRGVGYVLRLAPAA